MGHVAKLWGPYLPLPCIAKSLPRRVIKKNIFYGQADRKEGGWGWGVSALLVLTLTKCEVFIKFGSCLDYGCHREGKVQFFIIFQRGGGRAKVITMFKKKFCIFI